MKHEKCCNRFQDCLEEYRLEWRLEVKIVKEIQCIHRIQSSAHGKDALDVLYSRYCVYTHTHTN